MTKVKAINLIADCSCGKVSTVNAENRDIFRNSLCTDYKNQFTITPRFKCSYCLEFVTNIYSTSQVMLA